MPSDTFRQSSRTRAIGISTISRDIAANCSGLLKQAAPLRQQRRCVLCIPALWCGVVRVLLAPTSYDSPQFSSSQFLHWSVSLSQESPHQPAQFGRGIFLSQRGIENHLQARLIRQWKRGLTQGKTTNLGMIDFVNAATVQHNFMLRPPGAELRAGLLQLGY